MRKSREQLRGMRQRAVAAAALAVGFVASIGTARPSAPGGVPAGIRAVLDKPAYRNAKWTLRVQEGNRVLIDLDSRRQLYIGSVRKIFSVGVGDHGNELGFGTIYDTVVKTMPKGKALATVVKTDVVIPAMMSNWGCYGVEACLAYLLRRPELIHTPAAEERIVRACLDAGGLEAMYCTTEFFVDGLDGESSMAVVHLLRSIVAKNLEDPDAGLTH